MTLEELIGVVQACKVAGTCPTRPVRQFYFENDKTAAQYPVMFVCESPSTSAGIGDGSVRQACWVNNPRDQHFRDMLKLVSMEGAYITNVVKCGARTKEKPSEECIRKCLRFLAAEVELVRPRLLVCVGKEAHRACQKFFGHSVLMHKVPHYAWCRKPNYDAAAEKRAWLEIGARI